MAELKIDTLSWFLLGGFHLGPLETGEYND